MNCMTPIFKISFSKFDAVLHTYSVWHLSDSKDKLDESKFCEIHGLSITISHFLIDVVAIAS